MNEETQQDKESALSELSPLVVVGAAGAMGSWFVRMLSDAGASVSGIEADTPLSEQEKILRESNCILFAVPISQTRRVIEALLPFASPSALLCDLTSIKAVAFDVMLRHPGEVVGIHPMCGPGSDGLAGQVVVWSSAGRSGTLAAILYQWLRLCGARVVEMPPEQHDLLMAVVQGLNHFQSIVFAHVLGCLGITAEETMEVASPVYALRLQLMGRILAQSPQLYVDIERYNPHVPKVLELLKRSSERFHNGIIEGSEAECIKFFNEAASALGAFATAAKGESDDMLKIVSSRRE